MQDGLRIESLTARCLAGLIYDGKINGTMVFQALEEMEMEDKLEEIHELISEMHDVEMHFKSTDRG